MDRGLLARDRRRKKEPAERDAAGSATAHASTAEADDGTPDDGAETGGAPQKGPRRRRWWRRRDRSAVDRREPVEAHVGAAGALGVGADSGEAETADHPAAGAG